MDKLEMSIQNLEGDINALSSASGTGMNPTASAFVPRGPGAAAPGAAAPGAENNQRGGYTYGKSRKYEKGRRRRRTKKSKRKGSKRR